MEFSKVIAARRSIRKFKPEPVPEKFIVELLEAGRLAPSGKNLQPARFILLKSPEARANLKRLSPMPFVATAPLVIVCCYDRQAGNATADRMQELQEAQAFSGTPLDANSPQTGVPIKSREMDEAALQAYLAFNAGLAIEQIVLKAVDLGLGSCWVMMFEREGLRALLNLDERYELLALLPVGYPDQSPMQRPRLPLEDLVLKTV